MRSNRLHTRIVAVSFPLAAVLLVGRTSHCYSFYTTGMVRQNKLISTTVLKSMTLTTLEIHNLTSNSLEQQTHKQNLYSLWMTHGMLLSSFSEGILPNRLAQQYLQLGLIRSMLLEQQIELEETITDSVRVSPCCGPTNLVALSRLEQVDIALEQWRLRPSGRRISQDNIPGLLHASTGMSLIDVLLPSSLRFLYIPTAMYSLRWNSTNTPGKQRQRARADGKKRRDEIVSMIQDLIPKQMSVLAVTLDFDDGSIKHREGSSNLADFPKSGKEAIREWKPHVLFIEGGNTFWLYHCMEKGEWKADLINLLSIETKSFTYFMGLSAGAIVAGQSIQTACWKQWDDPSVVPNRPHYDDWMNVAGLNLIGNYSFFPHMEQQWISVVTEKQQEMGNTAICQRDSEVFYVDGAFQKIFTVDEKDSSKDIHSS